MFQNGPMVGLLPTGPWTLEDQTSTEGSGSSGRKGTRLASACCPFCTSLVRVASLSSVSAGPKLLSRLGSLTRSQFSPEFWLAGPGMFTVQKMMQPELLGSGDVGGWALMPIWKL